MGLERTRYFYGQVLGADDFAQEQTYVRDKARRHNRLLHGWGTVCGLQVRKGPAGTVTIEPGYALDPNGEEIAVQRELTVDLGAEDSEGNSVAPCAADEVSGALAAVERPPGKPLHIAIRYAECAVAPVPVADQSGDEAVAFSRTRESFVVKVLTALPSGAETPAGDVGDACSDRPAEPWVILAEVMLGSSGEIASIDCSSRRHVPRAR